MRDDAKTKKQLLEELDALRRRIAEVDESQRERLQTEESLRRSEERFRVLVENAADAFFVFDRRGRLVDTNHQACDSLGYTREEMLSLTVSDLDVDWDMGRFASVWEQMLSGGIVTAEGRQRRKDGTIFPVEGRIGLIDFGGAPHFFAAARDITARKQAEHQLKVLHELMRVAVSSLEIGEVFDGVGQQVRQLIDFDQLSVYFHKFGDDYAQGHSITSDSLGPLIRIPLNQSSTGDCIKTAQPILRRYFPDESPYALEHQYSKDWGFRSAMYLPLASRGHVFGVLIFGSLEWGKYTEDELELAREIADQLALVFEHALLYEESRETGKSQERNRLAREIHDTIAQELTRIMWQLNATERAVASGVDHGLKALEDVRNIVRDCLQQVRRSVWDLQSFELESRSLSDAIRREVLRLGEQGIQASMQGEGQEPESMDRECQLAVLRIAQEALNNTRRHSHADTLTISLMFGATSVKLQVSDDGTGFDPSLQSSEPSSKGGGFGMISMRERARLVGGRVEVQSTLGIGTRVEAEIPYQAQQKEAPTPTASTSRKEAAQGIRVLVVDDHEVVRQGIHNMLDGSAAVVVIGEAGDGDAAVEQIRRLGPDVVLMDIQMPGVDGVEAVQRMRKMGLDARVILLSVYANDEYIFEGLRAGARGYLMKDVGRDELVEAIKTVHEGGSLLQPAIATRLIERMSSEEASGLSKRELEVLSVIASGAQNKEISDQLSLSINTIKFHVANVFKKLGVQNRTEAVRIARERGLLSD